MADVCGNEKMNLAHIIPKVRATVADQSLSKIMYQRRQSFGFCAADTIWLERSVLTQKKMTKCDALQEAEVRAP
jgi:hypothetical protein